MRRSLRILAVVAASLAVALGAFAWLQAGPQQAHAVYSDTDGDGALDLSEALAGSNPSDSGSLPEDLTFDLFFGGNTCGDGIDNDGDGSTDGADAGCTDSDSDFVSNGMETALGSNPNDVTSFPEDSRIDALFGLYGIEFALCGDSRDNDKDGTTDAADSGCVQIQNDGDDYTDMTEKLFGSDPTNPNSVPEHEIPNAGSCSDGMDNDLDGMTDAADPGCQNAPNDDIADAKVIGSLPYNDAEKISTATRRPNDPYLSCAPQLPSTVWYSYTPSADGAVAVDSGGTSFPVAISVWALENSRLVAVGCSSTLQPGSLLTAAHIAFNAEAGTTYYVMAGGAIAPDAPGSLSLHVAVAVPPANDNFLQAAPIASLPMSNTVDTRDATRQLGEPGCFYESVTATVWYSYTPSTDTLFVADATGSNFAVIAAAYAMTDFGLIPVACSVSYDQQESTRFAFMAEAGMTYYIQAGGFEFSPSGQLRLDFAVGIPPANDNFAGATNVTSLPFDDTVDALTASSEVNEPVSTCSYSNTSESIWYRYDATHDAYLAADTAESDRFDLVTAVFEGDSLSDLEEVACGQTYPPQNRAGFRAVAGHTYYLMVTSNSYDGLSGSAGGGPPSGGTEVKFHMETLAVPNCAAPRVTLTDPLGDQGGIFGPLPTDEPPPPDITSISAGDDGTNACITVQLAGPVQPPEAGDEPARITINIDGLEQGGRAINCPGYAPVNVTLRFPSNVFVFTYTGGDSFATGYALFGERSVSLIMPLTALGGDNHYRVSAYSANGYGNDCAPNLGNLSSPTASPPGDVNCDGQTDTVDSVLILQMFANLTGILPCQYAGDVNQNGSVGPLDAILILQYSSGMVPSLPLAASGTLE